MRVNVDRTYVLTEVSEEEMDALWFALDEAILMSAARKEEGLTGSSEPPRLEIMRRLRSKLAVSVSGTGLS